MASAPFDPFAGDPFDGPAVPAAGSPGGGAEAADAATADASAPAAADPAGSDARPAWLQDLTGWATAASTFSEVRPGWFCFLRDMRGFVEVVNVSVVPARHGKVLFVDLADGRTLAGAPDDEIFVRYRR